MHRNMALANFTSCEFYEFTRGNDDKHTDCSIPPSIERPSGTQVNQAKFSLILVQLYDNTKWHSSNVS